MNTTSDDAQWLQHHSTCTTTPLPRCQQLDTPAWDNTAHNTAGALFQPTPGPDFHASISRYLDRCYSSLDEKKRGATAAPAAAATPFSGSLKRCERSLKRATITSKLSGWEQRLYSGTYIRIRMHTNRGGLPQNSSGAGRGVVLHPAIQFCSINRTHTDTARPNPPTELAAGDNNTLSSPWIVSDRVPSRWNGGGVSYRLRAPAAAQRSPTDVHAIQACHVPSR